MRKFLALATALLGALTVAAVASAGEVGPSPSGQIQTMEVTHSPAKGSRGRRKVGTRVKVTLSLRKTDGSKPSPTTDAVVTLPRGMGLHYRDFPACAQSRLQQRGPRGCPPKSRVGRGSLKANAAPVIAEVGGTVTAINGTNQTLLLYIVPEISSPLVIPGKLQGSRTLDFNVPLVPTLPGQPNATLTFFEVTVGATIRKRKRGRRVKINYIDNPPCRRAFDWKIAFTFENGETLAPTDSVPCTR
jgi:hypothetical protein